MDFQTLLQRLNIQDQAIASGSFDGIEVNVIQEQWLFRFTFDTVLPVASFSLLKERVETVYEKYAPAIHVTYTTPEIPPLMLPEYYEAIYAQTLKDVPRIEGLSVFDQLISERITFYVKTETDEGLVEKYVKSLLATAKQYFVELAIDIVIRDEGSSTEEIIKQSQLDSQIQAEEEVDRA
jgi:DNA polymerase III polC-type N-terminus.